MYICIFIHLYTHICIYVQIKLYILYAYSCAFYNLFDNKVSMLPCAHVDSKAELEADFASTFRIKIKIHGGL